MKARYIVLFILPIIAAIAGCASGPKLTTEERKVSFVIETPGVKKDAAYSRAAVWTAKTFRDSKAVLEVQDKDAGKLVGKGFASCNALRQAFDPNDMLVGFTLDITAKEGKSRLMFEDIEMKPAKPGQAFYNNVNSADDLAKVRTECLTPMQKEFERAVKGGESSDNF